MIHERDGETGSNWLVEQSIQLLNGGSGQMFNLFFPVPGADSEHSVSVDLQTEALVSLE